MLVRFILSGPVKFGPATIHGLPGQIADMDGEDLAAAVAAGMVEPIDPEPQAKPGAAAKRTGGVARRDRAAAGGDEPDRENRG